MIDGVQSLIEMEKALIAGQTIDDLMLEKAKRIECPEDSVARLAKENLKSAEEGVCL